MLALTLIPNIRNRHRTTATRLRRQCHCVRIMATQEGSKRATCFSGYRGGPKASAESTGRPRDPGPRTREPGPQKPQAPRKSNDPGAQARETDQEKQSRPWKTRPPGGSCLPGSGLRAVRIHHAGAAQKQPPLCFTRAGAARARGMSRTKTLRLIKSVEKPWFFNDFAS